MTPVIILLPSTQAAIARGRRDAREIVTHGERYSEQRRAIAWAALTGMCPHPQARRQSVNLGAPSPCVGWGREAAVISDGCAPWGQNDA